MAAPVLVEEGGGRVNWRGRGRQVCQETPKSPWLQTSPRLETSYIAREKEQWSESLGELAKRIF